MTESDPDDREAAADDALAALDGAETADESPTQASGDLPSMGEDTEKDVERGEERDGPDPSLYDVVDPQVHECNANLLFAPFQGEPDTDGMQPYFGIVSEWEPDMGGAGPFEAAGSTWDFDLPSDHEDLAEYGHGSVKYWEGSIATREQDSGERYLEYQVPVYDVDDPKRNRRINFQIRPALPNATHADTGERIQSLPEDLPEGVRVQVQASYVEPADVLDVLTSLASEIGVNSAYFERDQLHDWSRLTGLAYYLRARRDLVDDLVVSAGGLLDRLSQFESERTGRGEYKWNNDDALGKRHAVALDPTQLGHLYEGHVVGKLLKSYLKKHPAENAPDPAVAPTEHPKLEVQYSREYTDIGHLAWTDAHADADRFGHETLAQRLREYLLNAVEWAGLGRTPDTDVYVADDHFDVGTLDDDLAAGLDAYDDPIDLAAEHEKELVTAEFVSNPPTEAETDVFEAASDGGTFEGLEELAEDAGRSTSTVSRTVRKYERLWSRLGNLSLADEVIADRVRDIFATAERTLDGLHDGLDRIAQDGDYVDEDSALGKWADRWAATFSEPTFGDRLRIVLARGQLSEHDLLEVLRSGYEAATQTPSADEAAFAKAEIAYYDEHGDRVDVGEWVGVNQGGQTRILGKVGTGARY